MKNNINQRSTINVGDYTYSVGSNPYGAYNTDFGYWISQLVQAEGWFDSVSEANQYYNNPAFYGQMEVTTGSNPNYTYVGGDIAALWQEYLSVYAGGVQAQNHPVGTTSSVPDSSYDPQQILFQLSGGILGSLSTPQSITYNPLANVDNGDVQPACNETSAAILATDINTFGQLLIDQLDSEQIACVCDAGYYCPPSPCDTAPFTSLSNSQVQSYALQIVNGMGCSGDWVQYLQSTGVNASSFCVNDINNINLAVFNLCGTTSGTGVIDDIDIDIFSEGGTDVGQPIFDISDCPDCNCDCPDPCPNNCPDPCPDVNTGGGFDPMNPYGCESCIGVDYTDPCFYYCWSNGLLVQSAQGNVGTGGFVKPFPVKPFKPTNFKPPKRNIGFNGRKRRR